MVNNFSAKYYQKNKDRQQYKAGIRIFLKKKKWAKWS